MALRWWDTLLLVRSDAMVQWRLRGSGQRFAALVALGALMACASPPGERQGEAPGDGWRVVERVGEARHLPPGDRGWRATITGQPIREGSEVTTGRGGRLIIAMPGRHISVGPGSRFVLPRPDWDNRLEQRAGWLRYRVERTDAEPFRVHTRSLDIEIVAAILDVRVDQGAVDVTVTEGKVRLATPDGLRRTELAAGQSARASGPGGALLAVRGGPGKALEPIEPLIIPAIHPTPEASVAPVTDRPPTAPAPAGPSRSALDAADQRVPQAPRDAEATPTLPAHEAQEADRAARPAVGADRAAASALVREAGAGRIAGHLEAFAAADRVEAAGARGAVIIPPATGRRGQFQRLTEGMLDGVRSPPPIWIRP
ncbi:MAG: FecR domain-containing protein [Geminicoccaceae bacterium]